MRLIGVEEGENVFNEEDIGSSLKDFKDISNDEAWE